MSELPGGYVNAVVRIGDTVRRTRAPAFVHDLLRFLEGWPGAPRYLGDDEQGREILSYLDGQVPWQRPVPAFVQATVLAVARLVREFHDLTAGSALAGDDEVVCHNDLSPKNTVYRGGRPVAFIDWDIAAPGQRIHDVAHVCWQYVDLGPGVADPAGAARLVRAVADGYGLADRSELVDTILWWQDRCWRGIEAAAEAGMPAMVRLRELGAAREVREAYEWTATHRELFDVALSVTPDACH